MRRAIGVVRVSRVGGRDGESFVSPDEQRQRIEAACQRDGLRLIDTLEELDVSGGATLEHRPGLKKGVELVEAGEADVVIAAYFDRLMRSLTVQAEVVSRVEKAGGAIFAVGVGAVMHESAGQWLSGTMLGAVSEYHRRVVGERTQDATGGGAWRPAVSRKQAARSSACSTGWTTLPCTISRPSGWRRNSNAVAVPKFAPAPRRGPSTLRV